MKTNEFMLAHANILCELINTTFSHTFKPTDCVRKFKNECTTTLNPIWLSKV